MADNLKKLVDEYSQLLAQEQTRALNDAEKHRLEELREVVLEAGAGAQSTELATSVRTPRAQVSLEVSFNTAGEAARAYTRDVGSGGLALLTDKPLPKGTRVSLQIKIPSWETSLDVQGEVMWSDKKAMGIAFRDLEIEQQNRIKQLIAENTTFLSRLSSALLKRSKTSPVAARVSSRASILVCLSDELLADATLELLTLHKYAVAEAVPEGVQPGVIIVDLTHLADVVERQSGAPILLVNASGPDALTGKLSHVRPVAFLKRPASPARILQALRGIRSPR